MGVLNVQRCKMNKNSSVHPALKSILQAIFDNNSLYKHIDDLFEYSEKIKCELLLYFSNEFNNFEKNHWLLRRRMADIRILLDEYKYDYLQGLYDKYDMQVKKLLEEEAIMQKKLRDEYFDRIKQEEKEERNRKRKVEEEKQEKERQRVHAETLAEEKKQAERERRRVEQEKIAEQNRKSEEILAEERRNEKEVERLDELERRKQKEVCTCGIRKGEICNCGEPRYDFVKLSNNYYCVRCNKWKDRCVVY